MKRLSIGVRLTLWYLVIFALAEFAFGGGMWLILQRSLYDIVDDGIESQVDDVRNFLASESPDATITALQTAAQETFGIEHPGDYLAVYAETGEPIYQSAFLTAHQRILIDPNRVGRPLAMSRRIDGRPFRFIFHKIKVNGRTYTVELGTPADDAFDTLQRFRSFLLMFAPALLLVAALVGYWLSRRALSPVDELVRTARQVSGSNLNSRLQKLDTGDELQRLSETLNEMLDRIETAFRRVTEFTADASHELRTPVSLIRTEAELALRRSRTDAEYKEALQHILVEAERTTSLIEQLLTQARADSGREAVQLKPVNLPEVLRKVAEGWQPVAAIRGVQFAVEVESGETFVMGDETLLRRLADILLDNAFKYTPPPGSVRLALKTSGDSLQIAVKDSGIGIAAEEHAKIFERFYRVDKARTRAEGGTGLGLSIAQWITMQHRGTITVESVAGKGATFQVELPRLATPVQHPETA
jgi:heavy metal sensor kinase